MGESRTYDRANAAQKAVRRFASSGPGSWVFVRVAHRLDRPVFKATKGRRTVANILAGLPIAMLTTTGAKSGKERTVPVLGLPTEHGIAVIASNFGQERQPAWFHNLRANPEGTVVVEDERYRFRAVEVEGERREEVWQIGLEMYPGFAQYAKRASHRDIHVFVLERI